MTVFAEELPQLFGPHLFIAPFNDGAFVDPNTNWDSSILARINDGFNLATIADVPGIQANFVNSGFHGLESSFEVEMNVGNDRNSSSSQNLGESLGVFFLRNRDANDIGPRGMQSVDFSNR